MPGTEQHKSKLKTSTRTEKTEKTKPQTDVNKSYLGLPVKCPTYRTLRKSPHTGTPPAWIDEKVNDASRASEADPSPAR